VNKLREAIQGIPADLLAEQTGASYQTLSPGSGEFRLILIDSPVLVTYPDLVGIDVKTDSQLPLPVQALLA